MAPKIVLITGANRGIGKGILELYLKKPDHTVIAAIRDPSHPTSQALAGLPRADGTMLVMVKIDATSATDPAAAVKELAAKGINHVDILIANAAIALLWPTVAEVKVEDIQKDIAVNVYICLIHRLFWGSQTVQQQVAWFQHDNDRLLCGGHRCVPHLPDNVHGHSPPGYQEGQESFLDMRWTAGRT